MTSIRLIIFSFFFALSNLCQAQNVDQCVIQSISYEGNDVTKDYIIDRELNFHRGDTISCSELEEQLEFNRKRILNAKLFSEVTYRYEKENDKVHIIYKVRELFYWAVHPYLELADRNFNVWWRQMNRDLKRINIGIDADRKNFRGRNEEIGGEFQIGFNKHIYLYYMNPYISKNLKHGFKTALSYNTGKEIQTQTDFNKQVFHRVESLNPYRWYRAEASWLYRPAYANIHELQMAVHHWTITDSLINEQPNFLGLNKSQLTWLQLTYRFRHNSTDDRNYPESGREIDFLLSQKGLGILGKVNQTQVYSRFSQYKSLSPKWSLASHFRARLSFPQHQPFLLNRALGFKNDLIRGFEYYLMDGSHYALGRLNLRYKVWEYNFKQNLFPIIQHIPIKVYSKAYYDGGYAHNKYPGNSFLNNRFLSGYGFGLDFVISYYAKLRIEYSFNSLGENGLFLHARDE